MKTTLYDREPERYDSWFDRHPMLFQAELDAIASVGAFAHPSLEAGVGSGRFAQRLNITHGADRSPAMVAMARDRGIDALAADAQSLPWERSTFNTVLFITSLCFVKDLLGALQEARRVLKPGGTLIIAFLNGDSPMAKMYGDHQREGGWYEGARFLTFASLCAIAEPVGFAVESRRQTLTAWSPEGAPLLHVEQRITDGGFAVVRYRLSG